MQSIQTNEAPKSVFRSSNEHSNVAHGVALYKKICEVSVGANMGTIAIN